MNIYKISQTQNNDYDTYDSAVVIAENEKAAKRIHPDGRTVWCNKSRCWCKKYHMTGELTPVDEDSSTWCDHIRFVQVEFIGRATREDGTEVIYPPGKPRVVLASFNAG